MIKVAAIYGSHRRKENSDCLLEKVLEGIGRDGVEVTRVFASSPGIRHCTACSRCYEEGKCIIPDEMQKLYKVFDAADIVITATPVYFYSVTSELKKLIDRCQAVWAGKFIANTSMIEKRKRVGFVICTAGEPEDKSYFDCTLKVLDIFHKCINAKFTEKLLVSDVDRVHAKDRPELLLEAAEWGKKLRKNAEEIKKAGKP